MATTSWCLALMLSPRLGCGAPPPPSPPPRLPQYPPSSISQLTEHVGAGLSNNGYSATVVHFDDRPVVSYESGSSAFAQVFNPSWVVASPGTKGKAGLLIRTQNCSSDVGGDCTKCNFAPCQDLSKLGKPGHWKQHQCQDVITFAELLNDDNQTTEAPRFAYVDSGTVVMSPSGATDDRGVQDPRVAYDVSTGVYLMFYTCYNSKHAPNVSDAVLCLATTKDPTEPAGWLQRDVVFNSSSKSGALLIRESGPHFLYWGAGVIHLTTSTNPTTWRSAGTPFITETAFQGWTKQNDGVESGPPPMRLSDGNYLFLHNSWSTNNTIYNKAGYQPAWVIINGSDPTQIIARAPQPLWSPQKQPWMTGLAPWTCNVHNVAFLEAAHPTGNPDEFRVYFGGSDTVVGSAVVQIHTP